MLRYALLGIGILMAQATDLMAQKGLLSRPTLVHPAPLGVTVSGRAPQIAITWQPVPSALDYAVLRSADPSQPGSPVSAALTTTSFVDRSAAPGTVYFYTVAARFSRGTSTAAPVRFDPPPVLTRSGMTPRPSKLGGSTAPANSGVPAITGVSDTIIPVGGPPVTIRGHNLWDVTGVYFGTGTPGSWSNPRIVPTLVSTAGDVVQVSAPSGCVTRGVVMLEQYGEPGVDPKYITYVTQNPAAPPVRLNCAGKPVIQTLLSGGHPGSGIFAARGNYFSWVTQVTNLVDGTALSYQIVSDNQIEVHLPPFTVQQVARGEARFEVNLVSPLGSTSLGVEIFYPPPSVTFAGPLLSPGQVGPVEPGGALEIDGEGLIPGISVLVDGRPAVVLPSPRNSYVVAVTVPAGTANGTFVVSTAGGMASGTFTLMAGPSLITGVTPANASVGGRVTVTGQNLFRALGVCFADPASTQLISHGVVQSFVARRWAPNWQQWSNGSVTVDVPAGVASGYLGLYIPNSPGATAGACQWSSVTLQVR